MIAMWRSRYLENHDGTSSNGEHRGNGETDKGAHAWEEAGEVALTGGGTRA
jgi:hypothetical protein